MTATRLAIFDDGQGQWGPLTDLRAIFDVRTAMLSPLERIARMTGLSPAVLFVPAPLAALTQEAHSDACVNALPDDAIQSQWLLIAGRVSSPAAIRQAISLEAGHALVDTQRRLVAARLAGGQLQAWRGLPCDKALAELTCHPIDDHLLLCRPWDIHAQLDVTLRDDLMASDLPLHDPRRHVAAVTGDHPIRVAPSAKLHPMVVLNAEKGPIVIDHDAVVGSFAVVAGPCYVGRHTILAPHTHLRALSALGPHCVIGGEVSASVVQGYTNKCHTGYLGNSLVGQWVNLGADTNVSNLKNTFGHVRMTLEPGAPAESSGLEKLGPLIGDFVRTAIGSRLMTGSCIGTGAMVALSTFAPKSVARLTFLTDQGAQPYDIERFIPSLRQMMSHRQMTPSPATEARLRSLAAALDA